MSIPSSLEDLLAFAQHETANSHKSYSYLSSSPTASAHIAAFIACLKYIDYLAQEYSGADENSLIIRRIAGWTFQNAMAAFKLIMCGYISASVPLMRSILEATYLIDYFSIHPSKIIEWRDASDRNRENNFKPVTVRTELDKRDGFKEQKRNKYYKVLSRLGGHPHPNGWHLMVPSGKEDMIIYPFFDENKLELCIADLVKNTIQFGTKLPKLLPSKEQSDIFQRAIAMKQFHYWNSKFLDVPLKHQEIADLDTIINMCRK